MTAVAAPCLFPGRHSACYLPLTDNHAVTLTPAMNAIPLVLNGSFPLGAAAPPPYGMPLYSYELNDGQVAAVLI